MSVWTCARSQMFPGSRGDARESDCAAGRCRCVARGKEGAEPRRRWISCLDHFIPTLRGFNCPVKKKKKKKKPLDRAATRVTLEDVDPSAAPALSRHSCFLSALWTCFRLEVKRSKGKAAGAAIKSVCLLIFIFFGRKRKSGKMKKKKWKKKKKNTLDKQPLDTDTSGHRH